MKRGWITMLAVVVLVCPVLLYAAELPKTPATLKAPTIAAGKLPTLRPLGFANLPKCRGWSMGEVTDGNGKAMGVVGGEFNKNMSDIITGVCTKCEEQYAACDPATFKPEVKGGQKAEACLGACDAQRLACYKYECQDWQGRCKAAAEKEKDAMCQALMTWYPNVKKPVYNIDILQWMEPNSCDWVYWYNWCYENVESKGGPTCGGGSNFSKAFWFYDLVQGNIPCGTK